jgi:hypothetical protein
MRYPAQIVHHIPGRIRVKISRAKHNRALLNRVRESLANCNGVERVSVNEATGSFLIYYDPQSLKDFNQRLAKYGADENLFRLERNSRDDESLAARSIGDVFGFVSESIKSVTRDAISLRELFPLAIGTYAFFFIDRTMGAPLWLSMMFFSFDSYMDLHEDEPEKASENSIESLRDEIAALHRDIRALSERNQTKAIKGAS